MWLKSSLLLCETRVSHLFGCPLSSLSLVFSAAKQSIRRIYSGFVTKAVIYRQDTWEYALATNLHAANATAATAIDNAILVLRRYLRLLF